MENLPNEVILKVWSFLTIRDLGNCAQVSKRFKNICSDESLWKKINLSDKIVPTVFIEKILARGCEFLNLKGCESKITDLVTFPSCYPLAVLCQPLNI